MKSSSIYSYIALGLCLVLTGSAYTMESASQKDAGKETDKKKLAVLYQASLDRIARDELSSSDAAQLVLFKHLAELDLSGSGLKEVPAAITDINPLRKLDVSHNGLSTLPNLSTLKKLKKLNIGHNVFVVVPTTVTDVSSLHELTANNNQLVVLPQKMCKLKALKRLNVSCNQLQSLPDSLNDLPNIRTIDARDNQLTTVPNLSKLNKLQRLDLMQNPVGAAKQGDKPNKVASTAMAIYRIVGKNCLQAAYTLLQTLKHHKSHTYLQGILSELFRQASNKDDGLSLAAISHTLAANKKFCAYLKQAASGVKPRGQVSDPALPALKTLHKHLNYYRWLEALSASQQAYVTNPFDTTLFSRLSKNIQLLLWSLINDTKA